jgi:hypothetical protein
MIHFTVYDAATGQVSYAGTCHEDDFDRQGTPDKMLCEGYFPPDHFYVVDGQGVAIPARPSSTHVWDWSTKAWIPDFALADGAARSRRARELRECDWTQLPDVPPPTAALWATYRQALRDITAAPGYPFTMEWPSPPVA